MSYDVGADASVLLFGLSYGVDNMTDALKVEVQNLASNYGIPAEEYTFLDGSGGGDTAATNVAVTQMLRAMTTKPTFPTYVDSIPILAKDGSLYFVTDFQSDSTLTGATGKVHAKTGTYAAGSDAGISTPRTGNGLLIN